MYVTIAGKQRVGKMEESSHGSKPLDAENFLRNLHLDLVRKYYVHTRLTTLASVV